MNFPWLACELAGCPSTNNALERFNFSMKFESGNRIDLSIEDFLEKVLQFLAVQSRRRDPANDGYRRPFKEERLLLKEEELAIPSLLKALEQAAMTSDSEFISFKDTENEEVAIHLEALPPPNLGLRDYLAWRCSVSAVTRTTGALRCT